MRKFLTSLPICTTRNCPAWKLGSTGRNRVWEKEIQEDI